MNRRLPATLTDENFPRVNNTVFFDITKATDRELKRNKWEQDSFRKIYDSTTRWWFEEQP